MDKLSFYEIEMCKNLPEIPVVLILDFKLFNPFHESVKANGQKVSKY